MAEPGRFVAAIVGLFVAASLAGFAWAGVRMGGDTPLYIQAAADPLRGLFFAEHEALHTGYVALIAVCQRIGAGLGGVVLVQIALAAAAIVATYRMGAALFTPAAGALAALFLACDVDTARWNLFILTDSIYTSALAFAAWHLHRMLAPGEWNGRRIAGGLAAFALLASIRPEGLLLAPLAATYYAVRDPARRTRRLLVVGTIAMAACLSVAIAPGLRNRLDKMLPVEPLWYGETIWRYKPWTIRMPERRRLHTQERGLTRAVRYAVRHPAKTGELMMARLALNFAHARPFYSTLHNLLIVAWFVPVYVFAVRGWPAVRGNPLARWLLAIVAAHAAFVALTHADWDGRYLAHVLPLVYVFSGAGLARSLAAYRGSNVSVGS